MNKHTRLKVHYLSPSALISAYTTAVGKGAVVVPSLREVQIGDSFVLELSALGLQKPVEVMTEVVHVQDNPSGEGFLVGLRYTVDSTTSSGIAAIVGRLFEIQKFETQRDHPRVPVNLPGQLVPSGRGLKILDLSLSGLRLGFPTTAKLPDGFKRGARLVVALTENSPSVDAEVVWTMDPPGGIAIAPPLAGVRFRKVPTETRAELERLVRLVDFHPGPDTVLVRLV
ncbi:MAG: PilZ domain-containing protein [Myxococcales bacterium]